MISRRPKNEKAQVVIEFSRNALSVSSYHRDTNQQLATHSVEWKSEHHDLTNHRSIELALRQSFDAIDMKPPGEAAICLARSVGCVHLIEIPDVPDSRIYSIVQLQMEANYGEAVDQYEWDYVALESTGGSSERVVIAYSLPAAYMNNLRSILDSLSIVPNKISISETGYSLTNTDSTKLVQRLVYLPDRVEVLVCHQGHVLKSHSHSILKEAPCQIAVLLGTLRRLCTSLPRSLQAMEAVNEIALSDNFESGDRDSTYRMTFEATGSEAGFSRVEFHPSPFFLNLPTKRKNAIDLNNPSKPPRAPLSLKSKVSLVALCGLVTVAGYWGYRKQESLEVSKQIQSLKTQISDLDRQIAELQPQVDAHTMLEQWDTSSVHWDKQIESISRNIAASKELYVVRVQMDNPGEQAVTRVEGRAKSSKSILELTRQLAAENPLMTIHPSGIEPSNVDQDFRSQFRLELVDTMQTENVVAEVTREQE